MVPWRATEHGEVTQAVLDWYGRFAMAQPGAIVVEATGIRDIPSGPLLRIGHPRYREGLMRLVDRVDKESQGKTRLFIQLIDFLAIKRRPERTTFYMRYFRPGSEHISRLQNLGIACPFPPDSQEFREQLLELTPEEEARVLTARELEALQFGYRERVDDMELPHIAELPEVLPDTFSRAAKLAEECGFDGVELHYAHAYTMASFLSARNQRPDGFGGARENRIKVPLKVYEAVRGAVGSQFAVGCRILGDEIIEGGSRNQDACYFAEQFARAGMDFLSISTGGKFEDAGQPKVGAAAYPYTGPSGYECMPSIRSDERGPFARNAGLSGSIRGHIRARGLTTPVVTAGGINSFELAEELLLQGVADIIGSARQSLADPDWFAKMRRGQGESIRRCQFTNYCEALDQKHKEVTCQLWDRNFSDATSETSIPKTMDGKRRLTAPLAPNPETLR